VLVVAPLVDSRSAVRAILATMRKAVGLGGGTFTRDHRFLP